MIKNIFNHAANGIIWEIPAGRINDGEGPESCARRELIEEAGLEAGKIEKIAEFFTTPGFCTELLHIYLATQLTPCDKNPEDDEYIEIVKIPFTKALEMVYSGEIKDGKTMIAILLAKERIQGQFEYRSQFPAPVAHETGLNGTNLISWMPNRFSITGRCLARQEKVI